MLSHDLLQYFCRGGTELHIKLELSIWSSWVSAIMCIRMQPCACLLAYVAQTHWAFQQCLGSDSTDSGCRNAAVSPPVLAFRTAQLNKPAAPLCRDLFQHITFHMLLTACSQTSKNTPWSIYPNLSTKPREAHRAQTPYFPFPVRKQTVPLSFLIWQIAKMPSVLLKGPYATLL